MSYYQQGLASIGSDPLIWTPAQVRAEMARIRGVLDAVNLDVSAAAKTKPAKITHAEWLQWEAFYKSSHKFVTDASGWSGGNVSVARELEQKAAGWRKLVQSRGAKTSGPDIASNPDDKKSMPVWVYAGLAVGGIIAVTGLINSVKK